MAGISTKESTIASEASENTPSKKRRTSTENTSPSKRVRPKFIMTMDRDLEAFHEQNAILEQLETTTGSLILTIKEVIKIHRAYTDHGNGKFVDPDKLFMLIRTTLAACHEVQESTSHGQVVEMLEQLQSQFDLEGRTAGSSFDTTFHPATFNVKETVDKTIGHLESRIKDEHTEDISDLPQMTTKLYQRMYSNNSFHYSTPHNSQRALISPPIFSPVTSTKPTEPANSTNADARAENERFVGRLSGSSVANKITTARKTKPTVPVTTESIAGPQKKTATAGKTQPGIPAKRRKASKTIHARSPDSDI